MVKGMDRNSVGPDNIARALCLIKPIREESLLQRIIGIGSSEYYGLGIMDENKNEFRQLSLKKKNYFRCGYVYGRSKGNVDYIEIFNFFYHSQLSWFFFIFVLTNFKLTFLFGCFE